LGDFTHMQPKPTREEQIFAAAVASGYNPAQHKIAAAIIGS